MSLCPLLKKQCVGHECAWFTHIIGKHPQSGGDIDQWDCSVRWLPILLVETARQTSNVGSAVDSMRNEVVQRQEVLNSAVRLARAPQAPQITDDLSKGE